MSNHIGPRLVVAAVALGSTACGQKTPPSPPPEEPPAIKCAHIVLRPGLNTHFDYGLGSSEATTVSVVTSLVPGTTLTTVDARDCRGGSASSFVHRGPESFVVDAAWVSQALAAGCTRLSANSTNEETSIGVDSAVVRRGDASIDAITSPAVPEADLVIEIEGVPFAVRTNAHGKFSIDHLPRGNLQRIHGGRFTSYPVKPNVKSEIPGAVRVVVDERPNIFLGADLVALTLASRSTVPPADAYEPDDQVAAAKQRTNPMHVKGVESHVLTSSRDIDHIPISLQGHIPVRIQYRTVGDGPFVPTLTLISAAGTIVASANTSDAATERNPFIDYTPTHGGAVLLKVARHDDDPRPSPYTVSVTRKTLVAGGN